MAAEQEAITIAEESNRGITSLVVPREVWEAIDGAREEREETRAEWIRRAIDDAIAYHPERSLAADAAPEDGHDWGESLQRDPNNGACLWTLACPTTPVLWTAQMNGFDLAVEEKQPGRNTGSGVSCFEWTVHLGWEKIGRGRYADVERAKEAAVFETRAWMEQRGLSHVNHVTPAYAAAYKTYLENRNNGLVR